MIMIMVENPADSSRSKDFYDVASSCDIVVCTSGFLWNIHPKTKCNFIIGASESIITQTNFQ